MTAKIKRTHIFALVLATLCAAHSQRVQSKESLLQETARQVEVQLEARVGLAVYDTESGSSWHYNADKRFPMTSTFKVLACGMLLAKNDDGIEDINRLVLIEQSDLVSYSPVTENWLGKEVSLYQLCDATMRTSDNTAANKVLEALGGPAAVTAFIRSIGDDITRLDRWETNLNQATPGDVRDTTTPAAMATSLKQLLLGDLLSSSAKETLAGWLVSNEVGGPLLRSGLPGDWIIGDRTGAGGHGSRGVVAVIWPPQRAPVIASVYISQTEASIEQRNAAIASIGIALAATVRNGDDD